MAKGAIYVVLAVLVIAAAAALIIWLTKVARDAVEQHRQRELASKRLTAGWTSYLNVGKDGAFTIGVRRAAVIDERFHVFEGPIVMHELAADHDPIDVQLKAGEANDRASLYNTLREKEETR